MASEHLLTFRSASAGFLNLDEFRQMLSTSNINTGRKERSPKTASAPPWT
jgi:hypothetical protein